MTEEEANRRKDAANNFTLELKWSMERFNEYVVRTYGGKAACDKMWVAIEDVIVKTLFAAQPEICRAACSVEGSHDASIELFGFDIMLDENLKPWLIEVNTLPSLESSSQFDYNVKSNVVTDMMNLAQLQLFDRHPDVFAHIEEQSSLARQDADIYDGDQQQQQQDLAAAAAAARQQIPTTYLQPPRSDVAKYVHTLESLFDSPPTTPRDATGSANAAPLMEKEDSDIALLLRGEKSGSNSNMSSAADAAAQLPAVVRERRTGFMGRRLPTDYDNIDQVCRVRDELKAMGGFRLMFPTADKVERLGKFCHRTLVSSPRNVALWQDVRENASVYAAAAATAFPEWVQSKEINMDSEGDDDDAARQASN